MTDRHYNVTISGDSPEAVAYALFLKVLDTESATESQGKGGWLPPEDWVLKTYARCLDAVREARVRSLE